MPTGCGNGWHVVAFAQEYCECRALVRTDAYQLWKAATALRKAQRAYMDDRGNAGLGRAVAIAAERLDRVLG